MKDFYYILGLDVNCTPDEIREAYRKLSKKFHPDLNQQDNYFENRFKDVRQAYETLIDPPGRAAYDSLLKKSKTQLLQQKEPAKINYAKTTKSIDIAFTIMLIIFTLLFGDYVVKTITGTKPVKVAKTDVVSENMPVVKHHKKIHALQTSHNIAATSSVVVQPKTIVKPEVKQTTPIPPTIVSDIKPITKPQVKPAIVALTPVPATIPQTVTSIKEPKINNTMTDGDNIFTGAYIKSNSTGIVYMRATDSYNSDIVSRIPGNSRIAVLEKGANFYKISYNNKTGYVPKWTVKND
ncbi:MAG: DnaJ domain-containing protein [Mucilaginibacter sp.]